MPRLLRSGTVQVDVDAERADVWSLLVDIGRLGEWSHETARGEWVDGSSGPVPGARFVAHSRAGRNKWSRVSEVLTAEPGVELSWRTLPTRRYPDSTQWSVRLQDSVEGTTITQSFEIVMLPWVLDVLYAFAVPAHRDRRGALAEDLRRLGEAARNARVDGGRPAVAP